MKKTMRNISTVLLVTMLACCILVGCEKNEGVAEAVGEEIDESYATLPVTLDEMTPGLENGKLPEQDETTKGEKMVQVNGALYYDTGMTNNDLRCGMMDGEITSAVAAEEVPSEDDQSNFGKGYGYQYWGKKVIHINIDGSWCVFQASEAYRLTVTNGNNGEMVELERSPKFWDIIEKYNSLDVTKAENQTACMGYNYCLRLYDKEGNLMSTVTPQDHTVKIDGVYYEENGYGSIGILFLVLDTLFAEDVPEATASKVADGKVDTLDGVSMYVDYNTDRGANLVISNSTDKQIQFGEDYALQMLKGEEWYEVDYIIDNWAVHSIAYMVPKDEPGSWNVKWTYCHGILPPGQYRIIKGVMDFRGTGDYTNYRLAAEFEVK